MKEKLIYGWFLIKRLIIILFLIFLLLNIFDAVYLKLWNYSIKEKIIISMEDNYKNIEYYAMDLNTGVYQEYTGKFYTGNMSNTIYDEFKMNSKYNKYITKDGKYEIYIDLAKSRKYYIFFIGQHGPMVVYIRELKTGRTKQIYLKGNDKTNKMIKGIEGIIN